MHKVQTMYISPMLHLPQKPLTSHNTGTACSFLPTSNGNNLDPDTAMQEFKLNVNVWQNQQHIYSTCCTFPFGTNEDPLPNTYIIQIVEKGMREREKEKNQYQ